MIDMFEFPTLTEKTTENQIKELQNYLVKFKEQLEFILTNIGKDNLSEELIKTLNDLGADIKQSNEDRLDQLFQVTSNNLTIADVCNSTLFKITIESMMSETVSKVEGIEASITNIKNSIESIEDRLTELEKN